MNRLAERHTVQRIGGGSFLQRSPDGRGKHSGGAVGPADALEALSHVGGAKPGAKRSHAVPRLCRLGSAAAEEFRKGMGHTVSVPGACRELPLPPELRVTNPVRLVSSATVAPGVGASIPRCTAEEMSSLAYAPSSAEPSSMSRTLASTWSAVTPW